MIFPQYHYIVHKSQYGSICSQGQEWTLSYSLKWKCFCNQVAHGESRWHLLDEAQWPCYRWPFDIQWLINTSAWQDYHSPCSKYHQNLTWYRIVYFLYIRKTSIIILMLCPPTPFLFLKFDIHTFLIFSRALAAYTDALYNWGLLEQRASVRKHGQSLREEASRAAVSLFFPKVKSSFGKL